MKSTWRLKCVLHSRIYNIRYQKLLSVNAGQSTIFVHPPKTAGTSIASALGMQNPGHFTLERHLRTRRVPVERCIISTRDPIARLQSTFRYARKSNHGTLLSPVRFLRRFGRLEDFVLSDMFPIAVRYHYFFGSQSGFTSGIEGLNCEVSIVRQEYFVTDMARLGFEDTTFKNVSPDMATSDAVALSNKASERVRVLYADDYRLIAELSASIR